MYVVKQLTGRRKPVFHTGQKLSPWFGRKNRPTGRTLGGMFREVEDAGVDKSRLRLALVGEVKTAGGKRRSKDDNPTYDRITLSDVKTTAAELAKVARVLQSDDVDVLRAKDERIADLERELEEHRTARRTFLATAWDRAEKPVTIADLMEEAGSR